MIIIVNHLINGEVWTYNVMLLADYRNCDIFCLKKNFHKLTSDLVLHCLPMSKMVFGQIHFIFKVSDFFLYVYENSCTLSKQCWPLSDSTFCCIWSGSTLFANILKKCLRTETLDRSILNLRCDRFLLFWASLQKFLYFKLNSDTTFSSNLCPHCLTMSPKCLWTVPLGRSIWNLRGVSKSPYTMADMLTLIRRSLPASDPGLHYFPTNALGQINLKS